MFTKVLIANRGEIACRIIRTLRKLGVKSVAVYSEAEANARHVADADEAVCVGAAPVAKSYLNQDAIIAAAKKTNAEAIHPGYGLLSENAGFAEACEKAGLVFIGPTPLQMRLFGLKHEARRLAKEANVPLLPGTGLLPDAATAAHEASKVGFPVMMKSTAGGGGIGMKICRSESEVLAAFEGIERLGKNNFGSGGIFVEKLVERARHLEVQIFGDGKGRILTLGVRDCSAQRRNQKVLEETPPEHVSAEMIERMQEAARRLGESVKYRSAGTVEFVWDMDVGAPYFLEVNTRLQVEHGVTELVTGTDLVEWMLNVACGSGLPAKAPKIKGHAIEARIYAEDPAKDFQPSSGLITHCEVPEGVRWDTWIGAGTKVTPYYDPLLGKLLVHGKNRADSLAKMRDALAKLSIDGIETNLRYLRSIVAGEVYGEAKMTTRYLGSFPYRPRSIDVLKPGTMTTVQDYPGRVGYWEVGVPPSGPMDALSFRLGNRLLNNSPDAAGLEITALGPKLRFNADSYAVLTGAPTKATLDGKPVAFWEPFAIKAGGVLDCGKPGEVGTRSYLSIAGGIDVPMYLGSRSTFTLGCFGGHAGRALAAGDVLHVNEADAGEPLAALPENLRPEMGNEWEIGVLYGPHGAPDFFTSEYIEEFFETSWKVHFNSARTGVRLVGPKPGWVRSDGGEAGLHPSNIHDNAYAIGAIDFTGDMPILLGPEGPSLGGFVCPATVASAELWKMGQLRPGDSVRFVRWDEPMARGERARQEELIRSVSAVRKTSYRAASGRSLSSCILYRQGQGEDEMVVRRAGDSYMLAEFGTPRLSLDLRCKAQMMYERLREAKLDGIADLTPGIRSLQIHFNPDIQDATSLIDILGRTHDELPPVDAMALPSRIVHLPLSWDDPSTQLATRKYMQVVRPDAPWCPDNIEFIRRINGLATRQDVYDIVFSANYLVLGLGDVYLGAPVATPMDPRHRLVTTKYNPARTWTPENAVGIGGAYMCVYGMEGPGGYQFVGRTIQMWSRFHTNAPFEKGKPWLLRFFDQVKFYPVSADELLDLREKFPRGRFVPKIEETTISMKDRHDFLAKEKDSIAAFKKRQQESFEAERARWSEADAKKTAVVVEPEPEAPAAVSLPDGYEGADSLVSGSVWKVVAKAGDEVKAGQTLAMLESMKMEIPLEAPCDGVVRDVLCHEGMGVNPGQTLFSIKL
jgi:urea carboxylase